MDLLAPRPDGDTDFVDVTLPATPAAPARARRLIEASWPDLEPDTMTDVELIVTELVTNAVQHGRPEIVLRMRKAKFALDVAVLDHGPGAPDMRRVGEDATHGRGLKIIEALTRTWGCEPLKHETGKIVWASVSTESA